MNTRTLILTVTVILYFIGLVSAWLSYLSYKNIVNKGYCEIGQKFSCEEVYSLPPKYTGFLGIHFSVWAPIYFTLVTLLSLLFLFTGNNLVGYLLLAGAFLGVGFVPYLVYIETHVAHAFCLYCTIMHIIILANATLYTYSFIHH